jgi:integrase
MPRREEPLPGVTRLDDGRFEALVYLGRDARGKRQHTRRRFATVVEANRCKRRTIEERDAGARAHDEGMTVAALCERFLALPTDRRAPSTIRNYRYALAGHVLPRLGGTRLDRLSTMALQRHFDELRALGVGQSAVRTAHAALSGAFRQAVAWGLVARNPASGVVLPRYRPTNPATPVSAADARRLLETAARDEETGPCLWFLVSTGLRVGEACALGWSAVDLDAGLLHVRRHLQQDEAGAWRLVKGAKSKAGERPVKLSPQTVALLRTQRARQNAWRLALGPDWAASDLVFTLRTGAALTRDVVAYRLKKACDRLAIPVLTPHDLRSTHSTLAAEAAERSDLLALQQRLGHGDFSQTRDYIRPDVSGQTALADRLDEALRQREG